MSSLRVRGGIELTPTRAALYARVSTRDQDTTGQHLRLVEHAKLQGWEVHDYYEDHASGRDDSRPGLDRMMADAGIHKDGRRTRSKYNVILVTKLDRMMRSLVNMERIIIDLEGQRVGLIAMDQGIDTYNEDPSRKMVRRIISATADWEREMIVSRVKEGVEKAQRVGTRSGRPFGRPLRGTEIKGRRKHPLHRQQIVEILADEPDISIRRLADRLQVPRSTLYGYLNRYGGVEKLRASAVINKPAESAGVVKLQLSDSDEQAEGGP